MFVTQFVQRIARELTSCRDDVRRLQSEAESMTSRTGHVMASAALLPLDERLRAAQLALGDRTDLDRTDLADGLTAAAAVAPEPESAVISDHKVNTWSGRVMVSSDVDKPQVQRTVICTQM